ncbi:DUF3846 domain-containing protein [Hymenobacter sp. BT18]|uniref:DUF3846 domain-containing protein n=1 Tax=Hymenobacter sp. BT18 TaxID=2835648 RepID=UPI00143E5488|nr:DUF3846 domain-containing protein [Hymenobacter sp. BT18]QIX62749.1 DUF3846 domain-containing protein [Hymenobacter sp. BT18]
MKATSTFQPKLLDPNNPVPQPITPRNGRHFKLAELYELLQCDLVDVIRLSEELILIIDDEGKFKEPCQYNLLATYLWYQHQPAARGHDYVVGRVLLCHTKQFR